MAITLSKKVAAKTAADAVDTVDLVDQFEKNWTETNEIKAKIAKLTEKLNGRLVTLKKNEADLIDKILAANPNKSDDDKFEVEGTNIAVEFGAKGTERFIKDIKYIRKRMGDEVFFKLAKVNIGDVDKYLTVDERKLALDSKRTARGVKVRQK